MTPLSSDPLSHKNRVLNLLSFLGKILFEKFLFPPILGDFSMPNIFPSVNGQQIILPGVYGSVTGQTNFPTGTVGNGPLVFVAQSYGVEPNTPTLFTDPNSLIAAMRGAPSANFVPFIFNPSSQLSGASQVYLINVSPSSQSTASIAGTQSAGSITLTSANYGSPSNLLTYSLTSGAIAGYSLTVTDKYSGATVTGNNLGVPFGITYTGTAASGVTYEVQNTTPYPTFVLTSSNAGESYSFVLNPETFPTITTLINTINGLGPYAAYGVSSSFGAMAANLLDITSAAVTIPVGGTSYAYVTAYIADTATWVNTFASNLVTATATSAGPYLQPYTLTLASNVAFTGASNGTPTSTNYSAALEKALNIQCASVFIDSNEADIVALGAAHVEAAAAAGTSQPRRYVTGPALGATDSVVQELAASLNSQYATVAYPGGYSAINGTSQLYSSLTTAAMVAGMMAGNPPSVPLTNKELAYTALETNLSTTSIGTLQQSGVLVAYLPIATKVPTLATDVTTWLNSANPSYIYNQQVALGINVLTNLLAGLQQFIGGTVVSTTITGGQIKNRIQRIINRLTGQVVSPGYPVLITLTYAQATGTWSASIGVVLLNQTRYIFLNIALSPQSSTLTGSIA